MKNNFTNNKSMLSQKEVAGILGVSVQCLNQWRTDRRDLPPYIKLGKVILYPEDLFYEWLNNKIIAKDIATDGGASEC